MAKRPSDSLRVARSSPAILGCSRTTGASGVRGAGCSVRESTPLAMPLGCGKLPRLHRGTTPAIGCPRASKSRPSINGAGNDSKGGEQPDIPEVVMTFRQSLDRQQRPRQQPPFPALPQPDVDVRPPPAGRRGGRRRLHETQTIGLQLELSVRPSLISKTDQDGRVRNRRAGRVARTQSHGQGRGHRDRHGRRLLVALGRRAACGRGRRG